MEFGFPPFRLAPQHRLCVVFLAEFLSSWICLHVTALKEIPFYILLFPFCSKPSSAKSLLFCTVTWTHTQNSVVWIASWAQNGKWPQSACPAQLPYDERQRHLLLLTPPPHIPAAAAALAWRARYHPGSQSMLSVSWRHGTELMLWEAALDVPHTIQSLEIKASMIYR